MSALRTWLRADNRAKFQEGMRHVWSHLWRTGYVPGGVAVVAWQGDEFIREPASNLHKHGRDCDAHGYWGSGYTILPDGSLIAVTVPPANDCGVEGVWE